MIIGIDLGTTNSVAAYLTDDGPRLIPNALGEVLTPSVVGFPLGNRLIVGRVAAEYQISAPERCVSAFKRRLGSDWRFDVDGKTFSPEQLSAFLLEQLKGDAEAHLKRKIDRAVITVPAYFNEHQRRATMRAGQMVGLTVERLLNEPTAAALAYGLHQAADGRLAAVLDLGGGTFDVSLVQMHEGRVDVLASSGEAMLGGEDFTHTLAARILTMNEMVFERIEQEQPRLASRLIQQCERAKKQLSFQSSALVRMPNKHGEVTDEGPGVMVKRAQFEQWTTGILERIEGPIRRGLADAKLSKEAIHEVILVGGASRMPQFREKVRKVFERPLHCRLNPDEAVALGAAVYAGHVEEALRAEGPRIADVSPHTLGISISKRYGQSVRDGFFLPILHRNTPLPISRLERVSTLYANQTEVKIRIYQGESRQVVDNLFLGEIIVSDIPRGPAGQEVEIRFTYDQNGVLEVEAEVLATRVRARTVITRDAAGLSQRELHQALADMAKLKRHPREDLINETLLRRAERVYRELSMLDRHVLENLLDEFEEALEANDQEVIVVVRGELNAYLDRLEEGWEGLAFGDEEEEGLG